MAARKRQAQFYVYKFDNALGEPAYIGKGSGKRLQTQSYRLRLEGYEIARFWKEADAYKFEIQAIAEHRPYLNRHRGGNGSRATPVRMPRPQVWESPAHLMASRVQVAKFLLSRCLAYIDPAKVDGIRCVAHGWPSGW